MEKSSKADAMDCTGTIKSCTVKPECADLRFDGLQFTPEQYQQIARWVSGKCSLVIRLRPVQAEFAFSVGMNRESAKGAKGDTK